MKRKVAVLSMMLLFVGASIHAYAKNGDHVYVTIDKGISMIDSRQAIWDPQGALTLKGVNKSSSNNDLHVDCMEQRNYLPDPRVDGFTISPGKKDTLSIESHSDEKYYVRLSNLNWGIMRACNGRGDLYD